ncbi:glycosyltransferase [Novosphingobium sp. MMS21-SN21R]|uniref:glycosyltransferase n=1 Tax=Novosphingobium sp. MMS21-SN21R TaxID=2969298 RepID=UPI00288725F7|nr:glycosyltransferase [Novosphingobium sp. MMS21-SN21R]MDT0506371.1 glycosyltransferase [Novosphingobium sp. MMS21-SN21R]
MVENLPLPFDRRVWQEARTLKAAGALVSIICPTGKGYEKRFEVIDGIDIHRHPLPIEASGARASCWNMARRCSGKRFWHGRSTSRAGST